MEDLHIHMVLDGVNWKAAIAAHAARPDDGLIRARLEDYRARGVTFLRDGGDRWGVCLRARALAKNYGIDYRCPAFPIYQKGHYGAFIGRGFADWTEYARLLDEAQAQGADFIKLMISGLIDFHVYGQLTEAGPAPEDIRKMITLARERGFAVMAHANGDTAVCAALDAGAESIEHGAYLSRDTLRRLAASETVWVPTLSTIADLIGCGRYPDEVLHRLLAGQQEAVVFAAAQGAAIGCGSDAGAYRVFHGKGTQDEHALLAEALGERAPQLLAYAQGQIERKFRFYG